MISRRARITLLLGAVALAPSCAAAQAEPFSASGTVLTGMPAWRALEQCTRSHPDTPDSLWTPAQVEITKLERGIGTVLERMLESVRRDAPKGVEAVATDYFRQYVGVIIGGRRLIYVNGFHRSFLEVMGNATRLTSRDTTLPASTYRFDWLHAAVVVCDGGAGFFGVLYDPRRDRFFEFHFNEGF
jgi:hypothetical protein